MLTISEPELIKTIIVKDFHLFPDRRPQQSLHPIMSKNLVDATGEDWKRIRSITSPTFTSGKMKKMYPLIRECLNDFMTHLEPYAKDRKEINAKDMYGKYTMDVIASCAFATKTNIFKVADSPFVLNARKAFNFSIWRLIMVMTLPKSLIKLLKLDSGNAAEAREFFLDTVRQIIKNRRNKTDKKFNDFVQLMIDAEKGSDDNMRDENDVSESHHINEGIILQMFHQDLFISQIVIYQ